LKQAKTFESMGELLRLGKAGSVLDAHPPLVMTGVTETRLQMNSMTARPRRLAQTVALSLLVLVLAPLRLSAAENSGAIGQITPAGGVVSLVGMPGATVAAVRVEPGERVAQGAVLLTLAGDALAAEEALAEAGFEDAGTLSTAQVAAQTHAVELARSQLDAATRQLASFRAVGPQSTSANELARIEGLESQARASLQIEQARLRAANAEAARLVDAAEKRLELARAAMEIRAPRAGTILRVDRREGQVVGQEPIVHMGDLSTMYVVAQVYEGDLLWLEPGMSATVRNATLPSPLTGTVEEVSRLVDTRARLGQVRIRLDTVEPADRLVGMEVEVVIAR
jgi:multidrug resistance efflux pump